MLRKFFSLLLAALMLAAPGWALAWPETDHAPGAACQATDRPMACHGQAMPKQETASPCACGDDAPCQVSSAPAGSHLEALTAQAWQPAPPGLALAEARNAFPGRVRLAQAASEAPWRPPKPLYLRHLSLLI